MPSGRSRIAAALTAGFVGLGLTVAPGTPAAAAPTLHATTVVSGLNIPWDFTWVGSRMLYTLRRGEVWVKTGSAAPRRVLDLRTRTRATGEGGLLGIVADPRATTTRKFYTCGMYVKGRTRDIRVRRWKLSRDGRSVIGGSAVVAGLPVASSGRHSGCRLRFGADRKLYVGTGDAARGTNPQSLNSLGGKVLRLNAASNYPNSAPSDNPFFRRGGKARFIWTYGHRNVQGLALRPGTTQMWSAEHGSYRDDEVNRLVRGGNYGWNPVPGYNEQVPMTDPKIRGARSAVWSSGPQTIATSGLTFLTGRSWGAWQGAMAVGVLKDRGIRIITLTPAGGVARVETLAGGYGRVRAVHQGPDGALYFSTSNATSEKPNVDRIVRLAP